MRTYKAGSSMGTVHGAVLGYDPYMDSARAKVGTTGDQSPTQSVDIRSPGIVVYFWRKIPDPSP